MSLRFCFKGGSNVTSEWFGATVSSVGTVA